MAISAGIKYHFHNITSLQVHKQVVQQLCNMIKWTEMSHTPHSPLCLARWTHPLTANNIVLPWQVGVITQYMGVIMLGVTAKQWMFHLEPLYKGHFE